MKKYHIVADGYESFRIGGCHPVLPELSPENKRLLENFVKEQRKKAEEKGGSFYDGNLVGVVINSWRTHGTEVSALTQRIKYSYHAGLYRNEHNAPIQALYTNGLMITKDNRLVFGTTQIVETDWLGKLGLPAGVTKTNKHDHVELTVQALRKFEEDCGIRKHHIVDGTLIPGWVNGMSSRERNYHLTASFICPLNLTEKEMKEYFDAWKNLMEITGNKMKFKYIGFLPNEPEYVSSFVQKQDQMGKDANMLGKSLDVIQEWAEKYKCDVEKLKESKGKPKVYPQQPKIEK